MTDRHALRVACTLGGLLLWGCSSTTPQYDARFGEAVRHNRQAQVMQPVPSEPALPAALDAGSARNAFQRYRDSFKSPPPVAPVIQLGTGPGP